ncbi:SulP family inorganic anion transporter [Actinocorallia lasiicapitis]
MRTPDVRSLLPRRSDLDALRKDPRRDLLAGLTVAIVALPLALGFGIASGLGAQAGIVTAIIAGAVAAVFGGSNLQVSGPTGAMTVVLVPIVAEHGPSGVLMVGLLAGILLLVLAVAGIGRTVKYLPKPVLTGFTAGIAAVIALQQVPMALGVTGPNEDRVIWAAAEALRQWADHPGWISPIMALTVSVVIVVGTRLRPTFPFSLAAVALAGIVTALADLPIKQIGALPDGLPAPSLAFIEPGAVVSLVPAAAAVAALAALESLLCASAADAMRPGERHDPDRELFGQGLANLAAPLFGGVSATAAIARTAVNVRAGARSRLASFSHALILAAIIYSAGGLVSQIPLAALAGVLLATTVRMVSTAEVTGIVRANRSEALILMLTFVITVAFDLVTAVVGGVIVAAATALRAVAQNARLKETPLETITTDHPFLAGTTVKYNLDGPLFSGTAHRLLLELDQRQGLDDLQVVVLRMSSVSFLDSTGADQLAETVSRLEQRGINILITELRAEHRRILTAQGLDRDDLFFPDTHTALTHARALVTN